MDLTKNKGMNREASGKISPIIFDEVIDSEGDEEKKEQPKKRKKRRPKIHEKESEINNYP